MITDCDGKQIEAGALVESPRSRRDYSVLRIKANGRLVLWKPGRPRIRNADPRRWRLVWNVAEPRIGCGAEVGDE